VFNTAYHIVNRYGVVQKSSYRYGEITALVSEDTSMWDKTRKIIQARIRDTGDHYWEVQCRVLISVEDSEVATFPDQFQPLYSWKTIASDPQLEVRLNNEIRAALSGGAWQSKEPLAPKARRPAPPPSRKAKPKAKADGEVSDAGPRIRVADNEQGPSAEDFERVGVDRMRRGQYANAARAFRASLATEQQSPFAHFLLAQALFSTKKFDASLSAVQAGFAINAEWGKADLDLRDLYPTGSSTFARRLKELGSAAQDRNDLSLLLGYMHQFTGSSAQALAAFDRYLAEHPDDGPAAKYRALARAKVDADHGLEDF
jgi:tetratricopeptide (TPR) repeat protein